MNNNSKADFPNLPQIVEVQNGKSVFYKERYLYSKYNPEKTILFTLQKLKTEPRTLFLAFSPALCYGLEKLCSSLPENCFVLAVDADENLLSLAKKSFQKDFPNFSFLEKDELQNLPYMLMQKNCTLKSGKSFPNAGTFKRIVKIDFSAGIQFYKDFYEELFRSLNDSLSRFWKNRITLVKFGRRYSRNFFKNLSHLASSIPFEKFERTISKPILVLAAGESLEDTFNIIEQNKNCFFIIAVDAACSTLFSKGIMPDIVVSEEAQLAIKDAFIGFPNVNAPLIATSLSSWTTLHSISKNKITYFATKYDDTFFFKNLTTQKILPKVIPPLGSVGISATLLATLIRKDENTPIFFSGLDFSYLVGKTHARGTPHHKVRLQNTSKIKPLENYEASFGYGSENCIAENGNIVKSSPTLISYAETFRYIFANEKNIYSLSQKGLPLGKEMPSQMLNSFFKKNCNYNENCASEKIDYTCNIDHNLFARIKNFYEEEEQSLITLKKILTSGQNIPEKERNEKITNLLSKREYLYLHFPDGQNFSLDTTFLKRVRTEIDFFLKDIKIAKRLLCESYPTSS